MFFNEDLIQFIWNHQLFDHKKLGTTSDERIQILHQGYLNLHGGPDFSEARILINDTLFVGAVEIHVYSGDWNLHRHQEDKKYNRVILHVCYHHNKAVYRPDGTAIPTLELKSLLPEPLMNRYYFLMQNEGPIPCAKLISNISSLELIRAKSRMLVERLDYSREIIEQYLSISGLNWHYAFTRVLIRALGLPYNKEAFEILAMNLNPEWFRRCTQSPIQVEALLLGQSGLLISHSEDPYFRLLAKEYAHLTKQYQLKPLQVHFKTGRIRPGSMPVPRLLQLAAIIQAKPNLLQDAAACKNISELEALFSFPAPEHWMKQKRFKLSSTQALSKQTIRIVEINAVIPFLFYYAKSVQNHTLQDNAIHLLEELHPETNEIIHIWKDLNITAEHAADSQALLHLFKSYCNLRRCLECSIGKSLLLNKS